MTDRKDPVRRGGYVLFFGEWPSNWEPSPFEFEGSKYGCVEQFMMAEKARVCGDAATLARILAAPDPREQKKLGRQVSPYDDGRWTAVRYGVVLQGTIEKYRQNKHLRVLLLATGDDKFVECSPTDTVWGIGLKKDDPGASDPSKWRGQNLLGKAIDEARDILRREAGGG